MYKSAALFPGHGSPVVYGDSREKYAGRLQVEESSGRLAIAKGSAEW